MLPFLAPVLGIVNKFIPDKDKQLEFEKELLNHKSEIESKFVEYAKMDQQLRIKELESSGFKSWWRPGSMAALSLFVISRLILEYIIPPLVVYLDLNIWIPQFEPLPDIIWQVYAFCIVGLGGMRTMEKIKRK